MPASTRFRFRLVRTAHRYVAGRPRPSSTDQRWTGQAHLLPAASLRARCGRSSHPGPQRRDDRQHRAHRALRRRLVPGPWHRRGPGTTLVTLSGGVRRRGVYEIDIGTPLVDVIALAGGQLFRLRACWLAATTGTWATPPDGPWNSSLADEVALGCGWSRSSRAGRLLALCEGADAGRRLPSPASQPGNAGLSSQGSTPSRMPCCASAGRARHREDLERLRRWTPRVTSKGNAVGRMAASATWSRCSRPSPGHLMSHLLGVPCRGAGRRGPAATAAVSARMTP